MRVHVRPFNCSLKRIEVFGAVSYDLVHEGQRLNGSSFHHIDDCTPNQSLQFFHIGEDVYNSAGDRSSKGMTDNNNILFGKALHQLFKGFNGFTA
jgi:hypothetical protein